MQVKLQVLVLLSSIYLTKGANQDELESTDISPKPKVCNETVLKEFDECWKNMPQANYHGIPSNPKEIAIACSVYMTGMECVNEWSKKCLSIEIQEQLNHSIITTLHIYQMLCTDQKFREEYNQHLGCFNRVSSYWDACNNQFVKKLDRIDSTENVEDICCARIWYTQCVNAMVTRLCKKTSSRFLGTLNIFLMESALGAQQSCKCSHLSRKKNRNAQSASRYAAKVGKILHWSIYYAILIYYEII